MTSSLAFWAVMVELELERETAEGWAAMEARMGVEGLLLSTVRKAVGAGVEGLQSPQRET